MITLRRAQHFLIYCVVFFGPLGSLLSPSFFPSSFRFYYFFLFLFPLFFVTLKNHQWKTLCSFIPFLSYCLISAYFTHNKELVAYAYPLFRSFLFVSQCLFMFGAACTLANEDEEEIKMHLIRLYLLGFILSLIIGYVFYLGYYSHQISFQTIQNYSVEAQIGSGILRFAPGSYPNEYGNVASFVLSILLLLYTQKKRLWVLLFFSITFLAFLLTTTRAAYLSFLVVLIYLAITQKVIRRLLGGLLLFACTILWFLKHVLANFLHIFITSIKTISLTHGSTGIRISTWIEGLRNFNKNIFFGNGFGADPFVHNVYSMLLFELGLVGCLILFITLVYHFSENSRRLKSFLGHRSFLNQVTTVGFIHLFLFAATNHNIHHHLTWFVLLLFNLSLCRTEVFEHPTSKIEKRSAKKAIKKPEMIAPLKGNNTLFRTK